MFTVFKFPEVWGLPSASPFCIKLETYLRMAKAEYKVELDETFRNAPKGKVPYIEDKGQKIGDSGLIIDYLTREYRISAPATLSAEQQAVSVAMLRLVEEHLYWTVVYSRWAEDDNFKVLAKTLFADLPIGVRAIVPKIARKEVLKNLKAHGLGRHSRDEVYQLSQANVNALADYLGDKPYFFGDQPSVLDAAAFGILVSPLKDPFGSPFQQQVKAKANLVAHCERMLADYWPELSN